jgi:mRNA interferase MazF
MTHETGAPITSTIRVLDSEVRGGQENNLEGPGVISCDNIRTIPRAALGQQIGWVLAKQDTEFGVAMNHAFDLEINSVEKG